MVHELYDDPEVSQRVIDRFGSSVAPDGRVDRGALAASAFSTPEDRAWLEGLLWPRVGARIVQWRDRIERRDHPPRAAVVEVPLLFESGMEDQFDATIAVVADEEVRANRAGSRGHKALKARSARQLSQEEKAHRATYLVVNDGTVEELETKLSSVLANLEKLPRP